MIGSVWLLRKQKLQELELDATGAKLALNRTTSARQAIEGALAKATREVEGFPDALWQAQDAVAATERAVFEAKEVAARTFRQAQNAEYISEALRSVTSRFGGETFAEGAFSTAEQIQWQVPPEDEFGRAAIAALQAVANGEGFGRLCDETRRGDGRVRDAKVAAAKALESLKKAERASYEAQRRLSSLDGRSDGLSSEIEGLASQLAAAMVAEAEAQHAYNCIFDELKTIQQEHADAEAMDRCHAAKDDAAFTVLRIVAEMCSDDEMDGSSAGLEGGYEEEAHATICTVQDYLFGLGAVPSGVPRTERVAAIYWLVIRDGWHPAMGAGQKIDFGTYKSSNLRSCSAVIECVGTIISASEAFKEILVGQLQTGADKTLFDGESRIDWLQRTAVNAAEIEAALNDLAAVGGDIECASMFLDADAVMPVEYALDGTLPYGCVAVIAASGGTGKSHFAIELIAAFCAHRSSLGAPLEVLGVALNHRGGRAAYVFAEDPKSEVITRLNALQTIWPGQKPILHSAHGRDELIDTLEVLRNLPPYSLLVIDPGGKFLDGPDTDTNAVNRFFSILEKFAADRKAAILVMHHLTKGALSRASLARQSIKGATAWVDNPRAVYVMFPRSSDAVEMVLAKGNLSGLRWRESEGARYRKVQGRLLPFQGHDVAADPVNFDVIERVYAALINAIEAGNVVQKSGPRGLYALKRAELSGISRSQIEDSIDLLIAERRITKGSKGLMPFEHPLAA